MRAGIVFALLLLAAPQIASPAFASEPAKGKELAEFQRLVGDLGAAWNTLKPENAAPFYAKDAGLAFFDIMPLAYSGWTEYEAGVRPVFDTFESLQMTPRGDLRVMRSGNLTWTTGTLHLKVKEKSGKDMELDVRQTLIWEKRSGKWQIVHEHFSTPMPE